jgi:hypothetical protein
MDKNWRSKLSEALWAYRMAYKTPIGMTPYQLVYGKTCHLPVELKHEAFWAFKKWNMELKAAYHCAKLYKERTKRWHDK